MANADAERRPPFLIPHESEFSQLGVSLKEELHGGYQSRVFRAVGLDESAALDLVVKLIDIETIEIELATERLRVRDQVALHDDLVSPFLTLNGAKVNCLGNCLVIASPFIAGRQPEMSDRLDAERMGSGLARLHGSLRLTSGDLPAVRALGIGDHHERMPHGHQLLHGDYARSNLLLDGEDRLWVFDFDESGYGPVEFELGNSLFMALFDESPSLDQPSGKYLDFREWFVGAYDASVTQSISEGLVDEALDMRADGLRYWLDHLDEAPLGIRTATPEWHRYLRSFVGMP